MTQAESQQGAGCRMTRRMEGGSRSFVALYSTTESSGPDRLSRGRHPDITSLEEQLPPQRHQPSSKHGDMHMAGEASTPI